MIDHYELHHSLALQPHLSPLAAPRSPPSRGSSPKPIPTRRSSLVTSSESGVAITSSSDTDAPFSGHRANSVRNKPKVKSRRSVTNPVATRKDHRLSTFEREQTPPSSPLTRKEQSERRQLQATTKARKSTAIDVPYRKNAKSILLGRMKSSSFDVEDTSRLHSSYKYKSSSHNNTNVVGWQGAMNSNARRLRLLQQNRGWSADFEESSSDSSVNSKYVILYDFYKREPGDLPLRAGDRVTVMEKEQSGWWFAEHEGEMGYFPARYALPLNREQLVLRVIRPFHGQSNDTEVHLLKDQVVLQCGSEDNHGTILVETENIQTGKIESFRCPLTYLCPI